MSDTATQTNGYDGARALACIQAIEEMKAEQRRIKREAAYAGRGVALCRLLAANATFRRASEVV